MKLIRQIALATALTIGAFSVVTYTSCSKDNCKSVVCKNGGTCNSTDGSCSCATGYEGTDCATLSRDKFVGVYTGNEACTVGSDNYSITLTAASDALKLTLTNLYNQSFTATCTMTGKNTFSFSGSQTTTTTTTFNGTGTLTDNTLTVSYSINNGVSTNTCTFTGTK
ncbi:MAG: calcium-binding EGF-like domain-containing protein [Bacteroidetes bacterium]|nr:calcium-binding EGF-like domain-containing protein [Bacteroidota bacterium]